MHLTVFPEIEPEVLIAGVQEGIFIDLQVINTTDGGKPVLTREPRNTGTEVKSKKLHRLICSSTSVLEQQVTINVANKLFGGITIKHGFFDIKDLRQGHVAAQQNNNGKECAFHST